MPYICIHRHQNKFILFTIQAGIILCNFFLRNFALTQLENLHHFLNLSNNFQLSAVWRRQSMAAQSSLQA